MHFLCELFRSRIIKFYVIWLKNVVFRLFAHSFRPRPPFNPIFSFSLKTHTDETLDSVCLIYKAPDGEIIYRYLDADGNTRSTLRDFFEDLAGQLQTEGKRGDA